MTIILDIKKVIKDILVKLNLIADYVVEQGTSGIWTYRKWNSGIAECWGNTTYTQSSNFGAWGNNYISSEISPKAYPFTFIENPNEIIYVSSPSGSGWSLPYNGTTSASGAVQITRPASGGSNVIWQIRYEVKGLWKQLGVVSCLIRRWSYV